MSGSSDCGRCRATSTCQKSLDAPARGLPRKAASRSARTRAERWHVRKLGHGDRKKVRSVTVTTRLEARRRCGAITMRSLVDADGTQRFESLDAGESAEMGPNYRGATPMPIYEPRSW